MLFGIGSNSKRLAKFNISIVERKLKLRVRNGLLIVNGAVGSRWNPRKNLRIESNTGVGIIDDVIGLSNTDAWF